MEIEMTVFLYEEILENFKTGNHISIQYFKTMDSGFKKIFFEKCLALAI